VGVQKRCNSAHGGGSMSVFIAPICGCGDFAIFRPTTTKKKGWEAILGLS